MSFFPSLFPGRCVFFVSFVFFCAFPFVVVVVVVVFVLLLLVSS